MTATESHLHPSPHIICSHKMDIYPWRKPPLSLYTQITFHSHSQTQIAKTHREVTEGERWYALALFPGPSAYLYIALWSRSTSIASYSPGFPYLRSALVLAVEESSGGDTSRGSHGGVNDSDAEAGEASIPEADVTLDTLPLEGKDRGGGQGQGSITRVVAHQLDVDVACSHGHRVTGLVEGVGDLTFSVVLDIESSNQQQKEY